MPEAHTLAAANRLGALTLRLGDALRDATEGAAGMAGAPPAALVSLHVWADGSSVDVLADALRVTHSRAVRVVDRLEEAGLARRERGEADGRRVRVWLRPEGHALARRVLRAREAVLVRAVEGLAPDAVAHLDRAVAELLEEGTTGVSGARRTCRLCDADACGHSDGNCPVTRGADRTRSAA